MPDWATGCSIEEATGVAGYGRTDCATAGVGLDSGDWSTTASVGGSWTGSSPVVGSWEEDEELDNG